MFGKEEKEKKKKKKKKLKGQMGTHKKKGFSLSKRKKKSLVKFKSVEKGQYEVLIAHRKK